MIPTQILQKEGTSRQFLLCGGCFGLCSWCWLPPQLFWASVSSNKKKRFKMTACLLYRGSWGWAEGRIVKCPGALASCPGPISACCLPCKVLAASRLVCESEMSAYFPCSPAALLTSWLAYVYQNLFIKLAYIILNKHIKKTFWMSLAEQMNRNRWAIWYREIFS